MAVESIGTLIPTSVPALADPADIQAALKAYHYGQYTEPANAGALVASSIAGYIKSLQDFDLTAVTLAGSQTITGQKTITSPIISNLYLSDSSIVFEGATTNDFETTLTVTDPTADQTITFPDATGTVQLFNLNATAKTAAYTLLTSDINTMIQMNGAHAFTVSTGLSSMPVGSQIHLLAKTTGVTVTQGAGTTVDATPGLYFRAAYSSATLICLAANSWVLVGDLSAS